MNEYPTGSLFLLWFFISLIPQSHTHTHTHTHTHMYVHMHTHMFAIQDDGIWYDGVSQPYHLVTARGGKKDLLTRSRKLSVGGREWDIKMQWDVGNSCCYQCQLIPTIPFLVVYSMQKRKGKAWSILSRE